MKSILSLFSSSKPEPPASQSLALVPDRSSLIYHAGELVTGHIVIVVNSKIDISQVQISLKGKAYITLPLDKSEQNKSKNRVNGMIITHLKKELNILDLVYNPATVYNQILTAGRHNIGFSFMLPHTTLSSLQATEFGGIEYNLEALIQGQTDRCANMNLTVLSNPITTIEALSTPIVITNEKYVGIINGKRLWMKCNLPVRGYTLGSILLVYVVVENDSKKSMTLKCMLRQEMRYIFDESHKRVIDNKIASIDGPQIGPKQNVEHSISLQIPLNLPILQDTCPLIQIKYYLSIKLDIPGSIDLHCRLPLILTQTMPQSLHGQAPILVAPGQQPFNPVHGYISSTQSEPSFPQPCISATHLNDNAPPPGIIEMSSAFNMPSPSTETPISSAPYPVINHVMSQPAYNPNFPSADEALNKSSKNL